MFDPDEGAGGLVVLDDGESVGRAGARVLSDVVGQAVPPLTLPTDLPLLQLYPEYLSGELDSSGAVSPH